MQNCILRAWRKFAAWKVPLHPPGLMLAENQQAEASWPILAACFFGHFHKSLHPLFDASHFCLDLPAEAKVLAQSVDGSLDPISTSS